MELQGSFWDAPINPADVVYTPDYVSKQIIKTLNPVGRCLDPCKGDGAFLKYMPKGSEYCELDEGTDFLLHDNGVYDWVIGNPPYSIFDKFLYKGFEIADNVSFLVPTNKVFQRQVIMDAISQYGGLKSIIVYGSGQKIGFPFGFSVGNFHFKKGYKGDTKIIMGINQIFNNNQKLSK